MTWLAWRQFRAQAALAAVMALAATVVLVVTHAAVVRIAGTDNVTRGYKSLRLLGTGLIGVPAFIGAFWGAPLVAHELETGTFRLAWTQSVSRRRWLSTKLLVIGAVTVALTAAFSLVFTWWSLPFDRTGDRIGTANFGQRGIAPVGYAVFALVLGVTLGMLIKRMLPAMAATLVGFMVVRYAVQLVRPHLLAPVTTRMSPSAAQESPIKGGWILSTSDATGRIIVRLQPASRFWALQGLETAIFLALAAALAAVCLSLLRRSPS